MTEDIFDMSNMGNFNKEIEKQKMGDIYRPTLLCLRSAERRKASVLELCPLRRVDSRDKMEGSQ